MTAASCPALTNSVARPIPLCPPRDWGGDAYLLMNQIDFFTLKNLLQLIWDGERLRAPVGLNGVGRGMWCADLVRLRT